MNEEVIFQAAADLPATQRTPYLLAACNGQPELHDRIERLLASHDQEAFMQGAANPAVLGTLKAGFTEDAVEECGQRIGNYKLLQQIGEGGCGVVYMAQQEQPVRRLVALKILKLGTDTKSVIARFEQERQALAMMDHPSIAKVFDAGATPRGRPFFVMELIRGVRITDYCDKNQLPTNSRLQLFIAICHAIQHAHQKGIIHRDIKPSNILVTLHDGVPVAKVIDFGIAKATSGQRLTDATLFTAFEQFKGTPAYMSPEQAEMSGLDIDTRSDIYSLGVLLYELLTGRTPMDGQQLMASGIDAMRKTIREKEAMPPSTRLTQDLAAEIGLRKSATGLAIPSDAEIDEESRRRRRSKEQINRLRGDLDWIVMRCLEKDRSRRYDTANDLAADLQRHLSNEPVLARPPSAVYKLQKAWRRNKLALTASMAVAIALLAGIGLSTWQALVAQSERDRAQTAQSFAEKSQKAEKQSRLEAQQHLYIANMNLAGRAWEQGNFSQLVQLLEDTRHFPERGFEWYYWQRQAHLNLRTLRGHLGVVESAAFSPDGRCIVSGSRDQTARVWDAATGQELFRLLGHTDNVSSVAYSPNGLRLVTGGGDKTARVWDVASHQELFQLKGHGAAISCVMYSQNGERIITASADHTARVWDAATGLKLVTLEGHSRAIQSAAFSPDNRHIVTGSYDQTARIWDATQGGDPRILSTPGAPVLSVAFSPDGKRIVTGNQDRTVRLWDSASGVEIPPTFQGSGPICSVAFSPNGKSILITSWDSTVRLLDAINGTNLMTFVGHSQGVYSAAFSPDGEQIVTGGNESPKVWATRSDRESIALQGKPPGSIALAISPDGRRIVTGGTFIDGGNGVDYGPQSAEVWEMSSGKHSATLVGHGSGITSAAFSPNGRWIITSSQDQTARVWDADTSQEWRRLEGHGGPVNSAAFSPDSERIVTGGHDHTVRVWDVRTQRELFQLTGHTDAVTSVGFSKDSGRIVSGSVDNTARIWDAATRRPLRTLESPFLMRVMAVAFSPNGVWVVGGGWGSLADGKTVVVWNAATGAECFQLACDSTPVGSVAFSPDGRRIATGSYSGIARVWESTTGREVLTLNSKDKAGHSVAFSPDGLRLITGSLDLPARVWEAASPEQVAAWEEEELAATRSLPRWRQELAVQHQKQAREVKRQTAFPGR